jgi:deoxycytidylate deaminase
MDVLYVVKVPLKELFNGTAVVDMFPCIKMRDNILDMNVAQLLLKGVTYKWRKFTYIPLF